MKRSSHKRVKLDEFQYQLRDNVYSSMYPSPCPSYDPLKWCQNNDLSWLSHSLDQDIDKLLKIQVPELKKQAQRRASANDQLKENVSLKINQKRNSWYVEGDKENQLENSKLKINMSQIICEFPIQKVQRQSQQEEAKTPIAQKTFMEAIIQKYQDKIPNSNSNEKELLFQNDNNKEDNIINSFKQIKTENEQENNENSINLQEGIGDNNFTFQNNEIEKNKKKKVQKIQYKKKKSTKRTKKIKQKKKIPRITEDINISENNVILEKTKNIKTPQNLEKPKFNVKQIWSRMKLRKEAKKYEFYKTQEFQDLLKSSPGFYLHNSEGELRVDKVRPMQNARGKYFQSFELWINPLVLIGPLKLAKDVKLHTRFKKGYSGEVYCNKDLNEILPLNQVDGKTFTENFILGNNSAQIIKLVCCFVNATIKKQYKKK